MTRLHRTALAALLATLAGCSSLLGPKDTPTVYAPVIIPSWRESPTVRGVSGTSKRQNTRSPVRTSCEVPMSEENLPFPVEMSRMITPCFVRESNR